MALVTYHGPRPEITASFPMGPVFAFSNDPLRAVADILTFRTGRPDEAKKPGPHSYVLPKDHPVPVGALFALGLALWIREHGGLWLTVRLSRRDWALVCAAYSRLVLFTPRMVATPRRRRLLRRLLRRRRERLAVRVWPPDPLWTWPRVVITRWDARALRASTSYNMSVNEAADWRLHENHA